MSLDSDPAPIRVLAVSQLNRAARQLLESGLGTVWVEAELSNFSRPGSGHWYFSLKDREAQIRCAMFRARNLLCRVKPSDGMQLLARGRISLYEPRGEYQLIVEHLELAGVGALQRAFEALKQRLQVEGLFDTDRKRPLPSAPLCVGVLTSPTGAALRDILQIMARRCPSTEVIVYPVPVQGTAAAAAIVRALDLANERAECEVLIVARGGGSLEDLQAFNDEAVARAIARSTLPVISGVGHETDVTIADFVADVRAPTPSGAAALVTPDGAVWLQQLMHIGRRLQQQLRRYQGEWTRALRALEERLQRAHPGTQLRQFMQRLDELEQRQLRGWQLLWTRHQTRLQNVMRALHVVSPLATLERGFAIVTHAANGQAAKGQAANGAAVVDAASLHIGEPISARLARGEFTAQVLTIRLPESR